LAVFTDHRRIGSILLATLHKATGRIRFAHTADRGAAATILSWVQQIGDNLLEFARVHGEPVMIAEAAPQGYGLVERTCGSPSSTDRSLADEARQATGYDWCGLFCDPIRADADWDDQPM
jgi:hypothetical protein